MTAPSLILLAPGNANARVGQVFHRLRHQMQLTRPSVSVHLAFSDACPPTGTQVVGTLAARGVDEVVFVPLDCSRVCDPSPATLAVLHKVRRAYPQVRAGVARPTGPAVELLSILDTRLRNALSASRATELDGLVLSVPEWGDTRGNGLIARRARQWGTHHRLPVQIAHGDGSGVDVVTAIASLQEMGRRFIAVGSLYLSPTDRYRRMAELALASGAIAVSAPLGVDQHICDLAMARYGFAAMDLLDDQEADSLVLAH